MPTTAVTEPFSLAGMGDMLRESNADLAGKVGVDEVEPPKQEASPDPVDHEPEPDGGEKTPANEEAAKTDTAPAGGPSEEELAAEQARQKEEAEAAQKKKDEESAAAAEAQKQAEESKKKTAAAQPTEEQQARDQRDSDLNPTLSPHTHPKTRQLITGFKDKARVARDERDTIARERDTLKQQLSEAHERAKGVALPKETEEELTTLRQRVRELDITKDPAIEAKYDKPIAANTKSVVDLLKGFGADQIVDPKDNAKTVADPRFEANLMRSGVSLKTLQPFIEKLDKAGYADEAEQLREAVRENTRLARAKQQEIDVWKGDYDNRVKARTAQSEQQAAQEAKAFATESENVLKSDIAELAKTMPFLNPPPAPTAADSEPVRKAKQAALDEYSSAEKLVQEAVAAFNPSGLSGDKARSAAAKFNAMAVQGAIFKLHVIPRMQKDIGLKDARIRDLEAQLGKLKGAASISRQHATLASQPNGQQAEIPANAGTPDAFAAFAKSSGINVNS